MLPTPILRRAGFPGFWTRSMDEFKRQAGIAVRMEGIHQPDRAYPLVKFDQPSSVNLCKVMSDADMGGFSRASLRFVEGRGHAEDLRDAGRIGDSVKSGGATDLSLQEDPSHVAFSGDISIDLPPNKPDVQRSGYAAWRTRDRGWSLFGKLLWDIDPYGFLALRIKTDGRKYFVNIQTESIVPTDLHQHLLPSYTPGKWETVAIPFSAFVRTNYGMVVEPQQEMLRQRVRSVGIGLIDRVPGPFELCIADVYATNRPPAQEIRRADSGFETAQPVEEEQSFMEGPREKKKEGAPERIMI